MFSHDQENGRVVCLEGYGRLKRGAIIPVTNELYADVQQWLDEGNELAPFDGYPDIPTQLDEPEMQIPVERYKAEEQGVTVNGIRYGGSESNRQALREAAELADDEGFTEFSAWKDSDGGYHQNHPVADVKDALRRIGARRSELIGLESQYVSQAQSGKISTISDLDWATQYD